jgi:hypothetical protein
VSKKYRLQKKTQKHIRCSSKLIAGSNIMFRTAFFALALTATPALAAPHYQAEPSAAPATAKFVLKDTVWNCGGASCAAGKTNSRPAIVCASLAREIGVLRSFSANGEALTGADLDKCNARARASADNTIRSASK